MPPEESEWGPLLVERTLGESVEGSGRRKGDQCNSKQRIRSMANEVKFVEAKAFEGNVPGWVFRKGDEGIGYHRDGGGEVGNGGVGQDEHRMSEEKTGGTLYRVTIRLAECLGIEPMTETTSEVAEARTARNRNEERIQKSSVKDNNESGKGFECRKRT